MSDASIDPTPDATTPAADVGIAGVQPLRDGDTSIKMRAVYETLKRVAPDLLVDGEMQGDLAVNESLRDRYVPNSVLRGEANLLIFPNLEAANLSMTLLKELNNALPVGPILIGPAQPAHIVTPSVTARGIVNISAIAVVEAQDRERAALAGQG